MATPIHTGKNLFNHDRRATMGASRSSPVDGLDFDTSLTGPATPMTESGHPERDGAAATVMSRPATFNDPRNRLMFLNITVVAFQIDNGK